MLEFIKRNPLWVAAVLAAAVLLRALWILKLPVVAGDSLTYSEIARNVLNSHIYGRTAVSGVQPTLIRLPGYPLFLAAIFHIFGQDHYQAVMAVQLFVDIGTCLLVADTARRMFGERAARWALLLAALCPFTINYVATPLTECLELFLTALATQQALIALDCRRPLHWLLCGAATASAILLRPDGGILLGSFLLVILWEARARGRRRELLTAAVLLCSVALAPLVPWAIRNWHVKHVFQPLVTMTEADPDEFVPLGWYRWYRTWLVDYASMEDVGFKGLSLSRLKASDQTIDIADVPSRAFDNEKERTYVSQLFDEYNQRLVITEQLDQKFNALATEKTRRHPVRSYVVLPVIRILDMWLRPRTQHTPLDTHWWVFDDTLDHCMEVMILGVLNPALLLVALIGIWHGRHSPYAILLWMYPLSRTLFLGTTGGIEPRYTLECFPFLFILAAYQIARWQTSPLNCLEIRHAKTAYFTLR